MISEKWVECNRNFEESKYIGLWVEREKKKTKKRVKLRIISEENLKLEKK